MTEQKPCHNCRRRRLRCDRSVPVCYKCSKTGQRCLGYGQLYRWVEAEGPVGQEGQGQGQGQDAALTASREPGSWVRNGRASSGRKSYNSTTLSRRADTTQQPLNVFLADPLLQDLSGSSRYYLSYFATRFCQDLVVHDSMGTNPFRELIPMSQTYSFLRHIIVANSALHYYHAIRNSAPEVAERSRATQNALINALRARQYAIRELRAIIQERRTGDREAESQMDQDALLATVLFFVNFTLIDSGKDGWKDHLTAAGRLLSVYAPPTAPSLSLFHTDNTSQLHPQTGHTYTSPSAGDPASAFPPDIPSAPADLPRSLLTACDYVTSDTVAYFIWNSALESLVSSPSSATSLSLDYAVQPLTWDVAQVLRILSRTEANSYHSCPTHLMGVVLRTARVTQYRKTKTSTETSSTKAKVGGQSQTRVDADVMDAYIALLKEAEDFDVEGWALGVSTRVVGMLGEVKTTATATAAAAAAANAQELRLRCHIASAYRAAVCLYILLVAPGLPAEIRRRRAIHLQSQSQSQSQSPLQPQLQHDHNSTSSPCSSSAQALPTLPTTEDLAATIARQLEFVPNTSPLFKYTLWPVFLTGVDAVADADRMWVIGRLRAMRDVCPWGMMTSAMETLAEIWKLRDGTSVLVRGGGGEVGLESGKEWIGEDGGDWLARLQGLTIDCLIV
ncbi:fungal-specific transcription factor domain-containing protein [Nemania sp. FL0031]|nr:fungal-specific transcription factor domain-containing protein [Nemania sp. FL0031]